jgi:alkanesulfonate monooxygenase SsuD/methylene tetrahydromethanopterin reductase-like flavin-dependent oxidoreductase (luciferase family)
VIAQAGTSAEGMAFGGAVADLIYCANYSIEDGQKTYRSYKSHTVAAGRKPEELVILTGVAVIWGQTQEEAERTVSGEGHLNGKNPPPKEASTRIRLLIFYGVPVVNI